MERYLLAIISILLSIQLSAQFEVPNGNFEDWYQGPWTLNPTDWETSNFQLVEHVVPDSNSYEGFRAMQVFPFNDGVTGIGVASTTVETSAIPPYLSFAVKCAVQEGDTVGVRISFWNEGVPDNPIYSSTWFSANEIPFWTMINMPLDQIEPVIDYAIISVSAGNSLPIDALANTTWISVDAFDTQFQTGIDNQGSPDCDFSFYPSPTSGPLNINTCHYILERWELFDLTGKLIQTGSSPYSLSVSSLPHGLYLGKLTTSNGYQYTQRIIKN
jgi:hypothetical protein